jgi:hypothetical protein
MRLHQTIKLMAISLTLLVVAAACGDGIDSASQRVSGVFGESTSDRLSARADDTLARLSGASSDISLFATETVTLSQLQMAGIPVGSTEIGCDDPLDMVIVEGMFDRENIFSTGVALAGGGFEAMAMDMVAEIYDPETDMPLGMIGDQTGSSLSGITQSSDGSISTGGVDGGLVFASANGDNEERELVPEAVCDDN